MTKFILPFTFYYLLFSVLTGCSKPTYPKDKLSESVQKILKKEYNLDGSVKLVGCTLYLEVELPELLSTEKELLKKVIKKIQGAVLTVVRVSLSTDAKIDTVVTIAKVENYDFCIRIIQRVEDIKHFLYLKISKSDYEERLILETLPCSRLVYKDLTLEEFVARLIVSHYNMMLRTNPFLSSFLNNVLLELDSLTDDYLVLIAPLAQMSLSPHVRGLCQRILLKSYFNILKKYDVLNFPKLIKVVNKNKTEILIIKP